MRTIDYEAVLADLRDKRDKLDTAIAASWFLGELPQVGEEMDLRLTSAVDTREGWGLGWKWDGLRRGEGREKGGKERKVGGWRDDSACPVFRVRLTFYLCVGYKRGRVSTYNKDNRVRPAFSRPSTRRSV